MGSGEQLKKGSGSLAEAGEVSGLGFKKGWTEKEAGSAVEVEGAVKGWG